jgi:hypothetical protein
MSSAADTPTLALLCYVDIWDRSCALHPRTASGYDWQAHLRCLCRLARALHAEQPISLKVAGDAERLHIWALADVDPEMLILDVLRDRACRPHLPEFPLWWLDPADSHLRKVLPEPARADRPPPHIPGYDD